MQELLNLFNLIFKTKEIKYEKYCRRIRAYIE